MVDEREHPAASSYSFRNWDHGDLFSIINEKLMKQKKSEIMWDSYLLSLGDAPF